jgi:hypothetical protein
MALAICVRSMFQHGRKSPNFISPRTHHRLTSEDEELKVSVHVPGGSLAVPPFSVPVRVAVCPGQGVISVAGARSTFPMIIVELLKRTEGEGYCIAASFPEDSQQ